MAPPDHQRFQPPAIGAQLGRKYDFMVRCCCDNCSRQARFTPEILVRLFGPACTIRQAERRLRCSLCGARGRDGFVMLWLDSLPRDHIRDPSPPYGPAGPKG